MRIRIRLFAAMREAAGREQVELDDLSAGATLADARAALDRRFPALRGIPALPAVELEYAAEDTVLKDGAEVAFIPPVSGG